MNVLPTLGSPPSHRLALAKGLLLALVSVAVALLLIRPHSRPQKAAWPSVARSNLVLRAGYWYPLRMARCFRVRRFPTACLTVPARAGSPTVNSRVANTSRTASPTAHGGNGMRTDSLNHRPISWMGSWKAPFNVGMTTANWPSGSKWNTANLTVWH